MFDPSYNSAMQRMGFGDAPNCAKCGLAMTPENSKRRPELFLHDECLPDELKEAYDSVEPAHERIVTEAEHLAGRLKYLESLHRLRQESGITAAMLRDGRAKGFIDAFKTILRWCDRSGEEPEGQCLHEIEQICRKQLGLELVRHDPCANPQCFICNRELRDQAAYDQSMSDLAASGGIGDAS